jgi:hypothetical protein
LKKRTKKLLRTWPSLPGDAAAETDKGFLLLFFKKEGLSFLFNVRSRGGLDRSGQRRL